VEEVWWAWTLYVCAFLANRNSGGGGMETPTGLPDELRLSVSMGRNQRA
jgi:hypothetical protein